MVPSIVFFASHRIDWLNPLHDSSIRTTGPTNTWFVLKFCQIKVACGKASAVQVRFSPASYLVLMGEAAMAVGPHWMNICGPWNVLVKVGTFVAVFAGTGRKYPVKYVVH